MTSLIVYKIKTASKEDLYKHFQKCDTQFSPPLSARVVLKDYAQKLYKHAITFEAWDISELVGIVAVYLNNKETKVGFISNVSILVKYKKKGIASQLINMAKKQAIDLDYLELSLEVNVENKKAINFYKKYGFIQQLSVGNSISMCYILR